jgi:hypothetical protein
MLSMAYNAVISCNGIARILKDFANIQSKIQESKQPNSNNTSSDSEPITQVNNPPWFPSSYCQYAGICYVSILKYIKLLKLHNIPYYQPKDDCPIYLVLNEKNLTKRFSSFIRTIKRFETCWEGASEFLPMLTSTMSQLNQTRITFSIFTLRMKQFGVAILTRGSSWNHLHSNLYYY